MYIVVDSFDCEMVYANNRNRNRRKENNEMVIVISNESQSELT